MEKNNDNANFTNIGALALGFVSMMLISIGMYKLGLKADPPPENISIHEVEKLEKLYQTHAVFLEFEIAGHAIGAFVGAFFAALFASSQKIYLGLTIGVLGLILGIIDVIHATHPMWFTFANLSLYLPLAYVGARLGARIKEVQYDDSENC